MTIPAPAAGNNRLVNTLRRFWGLAVVAVTTAIVVAVQPFNNGPTIRSDGYGYHAWTYAILRGDLNFGGLANETYAFHETRPGYWWNVYPPGVALARFPVMVLLVDRGERFGQPTPAEHVAAAVLSALCLVAIAALLFYTCRAAGAAYGPSNLAILAVVFGTGLFHYSTYDAAYSHCWTALGMAGLAALVARSGSRNGRISALMLVILAAWLVLVRNTNVFALACARECVPGSCSAADGHFSHNRIAQYRLAGRRHRVGNCHPANVELLRSRPVHAVELSRTATSSGIDRCNGRS